MSGALLQVRDTHEGRFVAEHAVEQRLDVSDEFYDIVHLVARALVVAADAADDLDTVVSVGQNSDQFIHGDAWSGELFHYFSSPVFVPSCFGPTAKHGHVGTKQLKFDDDLEGVSA